MADPRSQLHRRTPDLTDLMWSKLHECNRAVVAPAQKSGRFYSGTSVPTAPNFQEFGVHVGLTGVAHLVGALFSAFYQVPSHWLCQKALQPAFFLNLARDMQYKPMYLLRKVAVMSELPSIKSRPWQKIAADVSEEIDPARLTRLLDELNRALDEQAINPIKYGPALQKNQTA